MNNLTVKILLACFCAAMFFLYNLSYKSSHNGISFVDSFIQSQKIDKVDTMDFQSNTSHLMTSNIVLDKQAVSQCSVYGPISIDNKNVVDILLNKSNITTLFHQIEQPIYEVYWNLGKDKVQAINLFEIQKNEGPLENEKYKISLNEDNEWIVSISMITGNENMARNLATNLAVKANQLNAGGRWQYKNKSLVYFYQTEDNSKVPKEVDAVIQKTFSINKKACQ